MNVANVGIEWCAMDISRAGFIMWGAPVKYCVGGPVNNTNNKNNSNK